MKRIILFFVLILTILGLAACTSIQIDINMTNPNSSNESYPSATTPNDPPLAETHQNEKIQKALNDVLADGDYAKEIEYQKSVDTVSAVFESDSGYAVIVNPSGFGGNIMMMVGVGKVNASVTGISIITHSETAGLGDVAAANTDAGLAFREQFIGKHGSLAVIQDNGEIDAVTGATITSKAIVRGVNTALECVEQILAGN